MLRRVVILATTAVLMASCTAEPESSPQPEAPLTVNAKQRATCESIDYSADGQGRLTFADEFDGAALDPSLWRTRDATYLSFDQALIRRANVSVHDGLLDITGSRLPRTQWRDVEGARFDWNRTRDYATGYVDTMNVEGYGNARSTDRFSQRYGHFEIRAKVPSRATESRGVWPAFWLRADGEDGEIDVMESYGAPTTRDEDPSAGYYWNTWEESAQSYSQDHLVGRATTPPDVRIWEDFHTYGVNWSPTCLRYTFDGETVGLVPIGARDYLTGPTFDAPFHLRLNMQVGSNYWGQADPEHTRDEFHFLVDWVRVHQGNDLEAGR